MVDTNKAKATASAVAEKEIPKWKEILFKNPWRMAILYTLGSLTGGIVYGFLKGAVLAGLALLGFRP